MDKQNHTVEKLRLEFKLPGIKNAFQFTDRIKAVYYSQILQVFDDVMTQYCSTDEHVFLDRIELDVGRLSFSDFDKYFIENLRAILEDQFRRKIESARPLKYDSNIKMAETINLSATTDRRTERIITENEFKLDTLKYFLENGVLPWWTDYEIDLDEVVSNLIATEPGKLKELFIEKIHSEIFIERAIKQIRSDLVKKIIALLKPPTYEEIKFLLDDLIEIIKRDEITKSATKNLEEFLLRNILTRIGNGSLYGKAIDNLLFGAINYLSTELQLNRYEVVEIIFKKAEAMTMSLIPSKDSLIDKLKSGKLEIPSSKSDESRTKKMKNIKLIETDTSKSRKTQTPKMKVEVIPVKEIKKAKQPFDRFASGKKEILKENEKIYINNSGLVLLNSYLNNFFKNRGLIDDKGFIDIESQVKAVHLLQFMLSKREDNPEYLLPLNKILCGLDLSFPINGKAEISDADKTECEELIKSVIRNWEVLKNISVGGFTNSFLIRNGILEIKNGEAILRVERKEYDILLEKLPWSFSIIKLSWMKILLRVEW